MNINEVAAKLRGIEYPVDVRKQYLNELKQAGIVIVMGYSDDIMRLDGAIHDEIGCYGGGFVYLDAAGIVKNKCHDNKCPYHIETLAAAKSIEAVWAQNGYSWTYETEIPHATFDVLENRHKYCRGIVFDMKSLSEEKSSINNYWKMYQDKDSIPGPCVILTLDEMLEQTELAMESKRESDIDAPVFEPVEKSEAEFHALPEFDGF